MNLYLYIIALVLVLGAQAIVSLTYSRYHVVKNKSGLTGFEVARKILDENGLSETHIVEVKGKMSDHFDPRNNVVSLSYEVFHDATISAVAIAAHECGHVLQHKDKYFPMAIRSLIMPLVNVFSKVGYIVLIIGFVASVYDLAMLGIILLAATLVFQIITLPVEFNASKRAITILEKDNLVNAEEKAGVSQMLLAAAFTYVAALLASVLQILRLFLNVNRR